MRKSQLATEGGGKLGGFGHWGFRMPGGSAQDHAITATGLGLVEGEVSGLDRAPLKPGRNQDEC